jgi:hypothetical protein
MHLGTRSVPAGSLGEDPADNVCDEYGNEDTYAYYCANQISIFTIC